MSWRVPPSGIKSLLRYFELALIAGGVVLAGSGARSLLRYHLFQSATVSLPVANAGPTTVPANLTTPRTTDPTPRLAGRLEVPRIGFSVTVVEGGHDEEQELAIAAVHLADTAAVGEPGNAVIAGHRDTAFWPLRRLHVGDQIRFRGQQTHYFTVESIRVVAPEDTAVLGPAKTSVLTLVTCYPFRFVGSAPQRFVVQAKRSG